MRKASNWNDLPAVTLLNDTLVRTGYRSDGAILTFNIIAPSMKRWKPHSHPFDQIVLIIDGHLILEVDGKGYEMGPRTIARVPGDVMHTGWPVGGAPVLNIDVFAPARPDYLFLTEHQTDFRQPEALKETFHQEPSQEEFKGEIVADPKGLVYNWADLPTEDVLDGQMTRSAFRGDDCLVVFNKLKPTMTRPEPHSHPFDQLVMVVEGNMALEVDGEVIECGPGSVTRVPSNVPHTGWPLGNKPVLNIDVFAPPRADYLPLASYQKGFANGR
ncbi:MAG: cupin domain-containing protein [Proteobacteria bacterium]|nr:cupin domain-containing protein [Pseudomonadota bacterium]